MHRILLERFARTSLDDGTGLIGVFHSIQHPYTGEELVIHTNDGTARRVWSHMSSLFGADLHFGLDHPALF